MLQLAAAQRASNNVYNVTGIPPPPALPNFGSLISMPGVPPGNPVLPSGNLGQQNILTASVQFPQGQQNITGNNDANVHNVILPQSAGNQVQQPQMSSPQQQGTLQIIPVTQVQGGNNQPSALQITPVTQIQSGNNNQQANVHALQPQQQQTVNTPQSVHNVIVTQSNGSPVPEAQLITTPVSNQQSTASGRGGIPQPQLIITPVVKEQQQQNMGNSVQEQQFISTPLGSQPQQQSVTTPVHNTQVIVTPLPSQEPQDISVVERTPVAANGPVKVLTSSLKKQLCEKKTNNGKRRMLGFDYPVVSEVKEYEPHPDDYKVPPAEPPLIPLESVFNDTDDAEVAKGHGDEDG